MSLLGFTSANALTTLLTSESLLFAVFALTLSLGASTSAQVSLASAGRLIGIYAATLLTLLATGAAVAWGDVFLTDWPERFGQWFPAIVMAIGLAAQPVFAWLLVASLQRGPKRDATDGL